MAETATRLPVASEKKVAPAAEAHWSPLETLHREIDRLFDTFLPFGPRRPSRSALLPSDAGWARPALWDIAPAMDLVEKDAAYEISAELPGLDEKNIEIKLSNSTLTIRGEKTQEKEEREKEYYLSERRYGSFQRSFRLPDGVNADKISAKFAKGVLTVTLPKSAEARKSEKKINVTAA